LLFQSSLAVKSRRRMVVIQCARALKPSVARSGQVILLLKIVRSHYYWKLASRSARLGLESLIVFQGHILAWKKISVLSFVGRPPWTELSCTAVKG